MAAEDNFIVAIELGPSKVTGAAGRKQPDGAIHILAFAQEPSTSFIRKGRINNVNKMTQCLINMKEKLEQKLQKTVSRVYVGIGGMGMHTVANPVIKDFDSKIEITQEMVDRMADENRISASTERDILEAVPQEYRLGTQSQIDPVGILAESIECRFLNIVANTSVKEEIKSCFRNAGINIADMPITCLALADAMLSEAERRSGCVFVDMGSETTSVAVFKNNILRHLAVIPLGGANVNKDIMSLQIEDDEAEELKLKYGSAFQETIEGMAPIALRDGRTVSYEEFSGLVEARMEEIVQNINNQIKLSKYEKSQLIGGLVITGGASNMRDLDKALLRDTGFEKIRFVRNLRIGLRSPEYPRFNKEGDCNAALAILDKGETNCCGGELGQPLQQIFEEYQDPKPVENEAERLAAAEAEAKAKEEAEAKAREEEEARAAEEARLAAEEEKRKEKEENAKRWRDRWGKVKKFFDGLTNEDA